MGRCTELRNRRLRRGADVAYRIGGFFGLGADFAWYSPFNRSAGAASTYPLNEIEWSGDLDAYVVPWPARAGAGPARGTLEPYLLGGIGFVASRAIAIVDPTNRHFGDKHLLDLCAGVGLHVFVAERMAITFEVRDLIYFDKVENNAVAAGSAALPLNNPNNPADPATWYSPNIHFTNAVQFRLGVSFFVL